MDEMSFKEILLFIKQNALNLDQIHVTVSSESIKRNISNNKQTITEWMETYKNTKTCEHRKCLRDVAMNIRDRVGAKTAVSEHGTFNKKFQLSSPYHFFLTTVAFLEETFKQPYSVSFHEIIDYTAGGEIIDSLHINFMLDLLWLATEYMLAAQYPKMTVIYGSLKDPEHEDKIPFDITIVKIEMPEFGCHHSKISIFKYKNDNIRIVISTANLYPPDWQQWTQGLWVSPILPCLPKDAPDSDGESVTHFKKDFMHYLNVYDQPEMNEWKSMICRIDFSSVKVFFFASIPTFHEGSSMDLWGHKRLHNILKEHATLPSNARDWPIVAQCSSVGVFGQDYQSWLANDIVRAMAKEKNKKIIHFPEFRFLYPTQETVKKSFDFESGVTALLYYKDQHLKQQWIENNLYEWKFETTGRTKAMPHCKSYTRISPDETEIAWFVLTSANLSKGAWGRTIKGGTCLSIRNYEAGVVFIPQIMINQITFPIKESRDLNLPAFLLPFDLPLSPYKPGMELFLIEHERPTGDAMKEL